MKFQILSVSLINNINKLYITVQVMKKYYSEVDFILIVPKGVLKDFEIKFSNFN